MICRLCHDLREAQQHAILLSKHRAVAKLGLFLQMLEAHQKTEGHSSQEIYVPMARRDIGAYVNMSPEAITRSLRGLVRRGVISVRDRRYVKIIDRVGLEDAISETAATKDKAPPAATRMSHCLIHKCCRGRAIASLRGFPSSLSRYNVEPVNDYLVTEHSRSASSASFLAAI